MTTLPALTVGAVVKLSPDPNYPLAVYSDTEWLVLAVYKNNSGPWAVGQVTKGSDVGSQTPLSNPARYELVTAPTATVPPKTVTPPKAKTLWQWLRTTLRV